MSRKKNKSKKAKTVTGTVPRKKKTSKKSDKLIVVKRKTRKRRLKSLTVVAALFFASFTAIASYKHHYASLTDLSVIGSGVPVVVQIHDPGCPSCRKLKSNTKSALARVKGKIHYRIADLNSSEGRSMANRYHAQKVTLLTFNSDGEFLNRHVGIRSVESLESLFNRLVAKKKSR